MMGWRGRRRLYGRHTVTRRPSTYGLLAFLVDLLVVIFLAMFVVAFLLENTGLVHF